MGTTSAHLHQPLHVSVQHTDTPSSKCHLFNPPAPSAPLAASTSPPPQSPPPPSPPAQQHQALSAASAARPLPAQQTTHTKTTTTRLPDGYLASSLARRRRRRGGRRFGCMGSLGVWRRALWRMRLSWIVLGAAVRVVR